MASLEKPSLEATVGLTEDPTTDRLLDPARAIGEMPEKQRRRWQRFGKAVVISVVAGGLAAGGVELITNNARQSIAEATQNHETINDDPITDTTNEPLPSASPEFVPMNPYTYELNGEFENVPALDLDTLSKEFTPTSTSFGEPVIEGALQTLANYRPTAEELDEFEAMARAEFEGGGYDNIDYRRQGVVMLAQQVLVKRAEMVIAGTTHLPTGNLDPLFKSYGEDEGVLSNHIIDAQIKKYEATLKGEDYKVNFEVLRETRLDLLSAGPIDDDSYVGPAYFNTYFSATDSKGKDLGAAWIGAATTFNTGGGEMMTLEDGQEVPALIGVNGEVLYDEDGNKIPALVLDDVKVDARDSLEELKDEYTMLS